MHLMAAVSKHDEVFQVIFFKLEMLLSPGDVGNSGPLLLPLVKLSIWHLL